MYSYGFVVAKGGVGKTSIATNTAAELSRHGKTVLIDTDPQGNGTGYLYPQEEFPAELVDVLEDRATVADAIVQLESGLFVLPTKPNSRLKLFGETRLTEQPFIFQQLAEILRDDFQFDYLVWDMGPGLNQLERAVLLAVDEVITPILPEEFSFDGVGTFRQELEKIQKNFKVAIKYQHVAINQINNSYNIHKAYIDELKQVNGYTFHPFPQDVRLKESQRQHKPLADYDRNSKFALATTMMVENLIGGRK